MRSGGWLIGFVGSRPKLHKTRAKEVPFAPVSVAEHRFRKGEDPSDVTVWHQLMCWNRLAEVAAEKLQPGTLVWFGYRLDYRPARIEGEDGVVRDIHIPVLTAQSFEVLSYPRENIEPGSEPETGTEPSPEGAP